MRRRNHFIQYISYSNNILVLSREIETDPIFVRDGLRGRRYYVSIIDTRHICVNPSQTRATAALIVTGREGLRDTTNRVS